MKETFWGVSVSEVEDCFQQPSVKQRKSERLYHENDSYPVDFWNEYFQVVQLTDIMRQKKDLSLACCLNSIRTRTLKVDLGVEVIQMHIIYY